MEDFRVNEQGRASGEGAAGTTKFSGQGLLLCMELQRAGGNDSGVCRWDKGSRGAKSRGC